LDKHVRSSGLEQHGGLRNRREPHAVASEENRGAALANEQLTGRVADFELNRKCAGFRVEDTGVMHVFAAQRNRIGLTWHLERNVGKAARRWNVSRRNLRAQFDAIGANDFEERRALVVRGAERRHYVSDPPGNRCAQGERVPGRGAAAAPQCFVTLREARLRRLEPGFSRGDRAASIFDSARRHGPIGKQTLGSRPLGTSAVECQLRL
jgi:hypothetical protein